MARKEIVSVTYGCTLLRGLADYEGDVDERFVIRIDRITETKVYDGRGRNWSASSKEVEPLAELSASQAAELAASIARDLAYCIDVAEARLVPPAQELPHSRACGVSKHDHGPDCHSNCPTCGGGKADGLHRP